MFGACAFDQQIFEAACFGEVAQADGEAGHAEACHRADEADDLQADVPAPEPQGLFDKADREPGEDDREDHGAGPGVPVRGVAAFDNLEKGQKGPVPEVERIADQPEPDRDRVHHEDAVGPRVCPGGDDENGAGDRDKRPGGGERHVRVDPDKAVDQEAEP